MAEQEKVDAPASEVHEKPTTHAKKAQFVAIILIMLLFVGLVIQTWLNMSRRGEREAAKQQAELEREAQVPRRAAGKIGDFAEAQKRAEAELRAENARRQEDEKRAAMMETVANRTGEGPPAPGSSGAGGPVTPSSVQHDVEMAELRRALEATKGKMGLSSKRQGGRAGEDGRAPSGPAVGAAQSTSSVSAPVGTGAVGEQGKMDAEVKRLQQVQNLAAERNRELVAQAQSLGVSLPPAVLAKAGGPAAAAGTQAAQGTGGATRAVPTPGLARPSSPPGSSFGELATNRVAREPGNSGPQPGEEIVPVGTVISAVLDMDMMSDYDGNWKAVLQRPVYDTRLENILLPAGTRITGKTVRVSRVNEAIQNRMGITVQWAIRPDGKRIDFKRSAGVDAAGVAALRDVVDHHVLAQIFGVAAYAIVGLGPSTYTYGAEPNSAPDAAVREATEQTRGIGRNFAAKYLSIVPTVTIRAGTPIKIFVEDDIYVTPWAAVGGAHFAGAQ